MIALFAFVACAVLVALLGGAYCLWRLGWRLPPTLLVIAAGIYCVYAYLAIAGYPAPPSDALYLWSTIVVLSILILALFVVGTSVILDAPRQSATAGFVYVCAVLWIAAFSIFMLGILPTSGYLMYGVVFAVAQLCFLHVLAWAIGSRPFGFPVFVLGARAYPTFFLYPVLLALLTLPAMCTNGIAIFFLISASLLVTALVVVWTYRVACHWCCKIYRPSAIICCNRHRVPKGYRCHHHTCLNYKPHSKTRQR